eukprot:3391574-Amphidinium_carterae.1
MMEKQTLKVKVLNSGSMSREQTRTVAMKAVFKREAAPCAQSAPQIPRTYLPSSTLLWFQVLTETEHLCGSFQMTLSCISSGGG